MVLEASSGASARLNAMRIHVVGSSLLLLIPKDSRDAGGAGHGVYVVIV